MAAALLGASPDLCAQTSGANGTHDPSRIVESDGRFYFCSTGGGCASSTDGLVWKSTGLRIPMPSWADQYAPNGNQGIWAPDLIFYRDQFYIFYSFCGLPAANAPCVIGAYTTPTLNSMSPAFKLSDQGMVVNNPTNDATYQFSTIDPGPILDPAGNLWISWGSGFGKDQSKTQLWATRLDTTGLPLSSDSAYEPPTLLGHALETGRKEGSYLYRRGDYYYLFYNTGSCCNGTSSDYTIWVARSSNISGPFAGDRVFYASNGDIHGPGHLGIYDGCGVDRFTYHYYPSANSVLGENDLTWSNDWPVAGKPSTTPLVPCGTNDGNGASGSGGTSAGGASGGTNNGGSSPAGASSGGASGGTNNGGSSPAGASSGGSSAGTNNGGMDASGSNSAGTSNASGTSGANASGGAAGMTTSTGGSANSSGSTAQTPTSAVDGASSSHSSCSCRFVAQRERRGLLFVFWGVAWFARARRGRRKGAAH